VGTGVKKIFPSRTEKLKLELGFIEKQGFQFSRIGKGMRELVGCIEYSRIRLLLSLSDHFLPLYTPLLIFSSQVRGGNFFE
jgi:hypothetical protein